MDNFRQESTTRFRSVLRKPKPAASILLNAVPPGLTSRRTSLLALSTSALFAVWCEKRGLHSSGVSNLPISRASRLRKRLALPIERVADNHNPAENELPLPIGYHRQ